MSRIRATAIQSYMTQPFLCPSHVGSELARDLSGMTPYKFALATQRLHRVSTDSFRPQVHSTSSRSCTYW